MKPNVDSSVPPWRSQKIRRVQLKLHAIRPAKCLSDWVVTCRHCGANKLPVREGKKNEVKESEIESGYCPRSFSAECCNIMQLAGFPSHRIEFYMGLCCPSWRVLGERCRRHVSAICENHFI